MNEIAEYWDRQPCGSLHPDPTAQRYFVQSHIPRFAQFWKWRGKRVLEIGCGIGTDTIQFVDAGASVWAVDQSAKSVEIAMERCSVASFAVANAEQWLPTGRFDLIYSFGVLHHTPLPEMVLLNARRRMAQDGELRIMLYAKWSVKHLMGTQPEAQAGCPLVKWYSASEARALVESCGFRVRSIEKTHIFPWRIPDYVQHHYVKAWTWRWMPKWLFSLCERVGGHHLLIKAVPA